MSIVTAVFMAGGMWKTVSDHGKRLDNHDVKLESHGQSITRMEAWTAGYNAASKRD